MFLISFDSNSGSFDDLDPKMLIFNRIPKTGSENLAYVIKQLSMVNNFTHIRYGNPDHRLISRKDQVRSKILVDLNPCFEFYFVYS